ncbi:YdcF family protein [Pseudobutyrivibrio sp.]|uniref:YdcF family protein n=1 Tax=Pseudobutyrivibrio sp. TaxID=2014367 RepID=UPI0025D1DF8D|nr:YdcF family protein [Pseudobutyrivibrio sp.]MBR5648443.1 YdcF family protein [Pseudobutyrivibrio sp.]
MKVKRFVYTIIMIASLIYSVIVFMVGSGTFSYAIWLAAALFFGFLLFMDNKDRWKKLPKGIRGIFNGIVAAALVVFIICQGCILSQFFSKGEADADYLIVLGAQMRDNGPSIVFRYRLDAAADYLKKNPNAKVVVTGGQGANESISEGEGGKAYLMEQGISEERIITETESVNTEENIVNAISLIKADTAKSEADMKIAVVTNNFHLFRGTLLAKRHTDATVIGIAAHTEYLYIPNNMVRESFGILKDLV